MYRKDKREFLARFDQCGYNHSKRVFTIHIARSVQRNHPVAARLDGEIVRCTVRFNLRAQQLVRIDHDIAHALDLFARHAFTLEVLVTVGRR